MSVQAIKFVAVIFLNAALSFIGLAATMSWLEMEPTVGLVIFELTLSLAIAAAATLALARRIQP